MAKKEREEVELAFNLELETRKATQGLALIEKALRKTASRSVEVKLDKKGLATFRKETKQYERDLQGMAKVIRAVGGDKNLTKSTKGFGALRAAHKKFDAKLKSETIKSERERNLIKAKMAKASTAAEKKHYEQALKDERKAFRKSLESAKKDVVKHRRAVSKDMAGGVNAKIFEKHSEHTQKQREKAEAQQKGLSEMKTAEIGKELGESFGDAVSSLAGKDIMGFAKGGAKISAAMLKGAGKYGMAIGRNMEIKGAGGGTGAMAGIGKMLQGIGPLVQTLAKLGPILGAAASSFGAIFKLILDVESAAKDMNKQLLEGASTAETFAASGGKADTGYRNLSTTLDQIRSEATSMENLKWGIKAEDIVRTTNALAQQGVTLESMKTEFKNAGNASDAAARQIQGFGDMARMSFAYSRLMGVSMQEITDFQAEMFTDMGQSLSGMQLQFSRMTKEANESGIATNKFFSIIRGVSSDLGLYTTRIEQAASMLKLLGKAMNPKEAQKFLSTAAQGFKQMGEEDRVRMTMLVGEKKMRGIIGKDLERKSKLMNADIAKAAGVSLDAVVKAAEDETGKAMDGILAKMDDKKRGAFQSARTEMTQDRKALKNGGSFGTGEAAANLSAAGALEATTAALQRFGGNKKLKDMTGLQGYGARKSANVSLDQFRAMVKLEASVDKQREEMKKALTDPKNPANQDIARRLEALGVTLGNIDQASTSDIIAATGLSDKEAMEMASEQEDYAKKTSELTATLGDKMGIVVDGIFNYLYTALKDIISIAHKILNAMGLTSIGDNLEAGRNSKNDDLVNRLTESTAGKTGAAATRGMLDTVQEAVTKAFAAAKGDGTVRNDEARAAVQEDLKKLLSSGSLDERSQRLKQISGMTGIGADKKASIQHSAEQGNSISDAIKMAGLTFEELEALYKQSLKLQYFKPATDVAELATGLGMAAKGAVGSESVGGAPSLAQARARAAEGMSNTGQAAATQVASGSAVSNAPGPVGAAAPLITGGGQMMASPVTGTMVDMPTEGAEQLDMMGRENVQNLQNLYDALRRRGIVIDKSHLSGPVQEAIRKGTLEAFREALFEQAIYSSSDPSATLKRMQDSGLGNVSNMADKYETEVLGKNAVGGQVVGIASGKAVIAAPGEGLASVGRGEKITPAGSGGGSSINLNVNGIGGADLANFLKKKMNEAIYEYKRREKLQ
jgi:hypothetical protein